MLTAALSLAAAHALREEVDGTTARLGVQHLSNAYFRKSLEERHPGSQRRHKWDGCGDDAQPLQVRESVAARSPHPRRQT